MLSTISFFGGPGRRAVTPVGFALPADLIQRMETHVVGVKVRKITGLLRPTRREYLHFLADTQPFLNLRFRCCAELLDGVLRFHGEPPLLAGGRGASWSARGDYATTVPIFFFSMILNER